MERGGDTRPIRAGEELDLAKLETYLRDRLKAAGPLMVEQFPHGHSNLTYWLQMGDREMVLRRPPFGNQVKTAHDMSREFRVLFRLCDVYPPAPRPYLYCDDPQIIGAPFYVMERRRGVVLRRALPGDFHADPDQVRRMSFALIDNLAALHGLDYEAAGLADLGKPEGYVARQVSGWIGRYEKARTDDIPAMNAIADWLPSHMPASSGAALIHNDYKYDNILLDAADLTHIVAVLDWEMATLGDPLMDLGATLGYWVEAGDPKGMQAFAVGPTMLPGSPTRMEMADRYAQITGRDISELLFYYVFGLYKTAVIIQQIYARYVRGFTKDERFAQLNQWVIATAEQARHALDTSQYSTVASSF